ncbi:WG repeat-containing protein [Pelobium manganitolerans]|uniref:WG repeat-containing protein n=1 Tax=Pelobium manganitolerans TaxID=1842495 RepID=UPI003FA376CF
MKTILKTTAIAICTFIATAVQAQQLVVFEENGKAGFKDQSGKIIIAPKYDDYRTKDASRTKDDEVYRVAINEKWGLIDGKTGKELTPLKYKKINAFSDGLAGVLLDFKWGFIDKNGKEVFPLKYDEPSPYGVYGLGYDFYDGIAVVSIGYKCGVIDKTGKEIVPFKYHSIGEFSEGMASIRLADKFGFVNKSGKEIVPAKYDDVRRFKDGFAKVSLAGKWGTIDKTGKEIIAVKYDDIHDFNRGLACVGIGDNWGYVDTTGKEVIPLKFEETFWADENTIHARKADGTVVKFDKKGNELKKENR